MAITMVEDFCSVAEQKKEFDREYRKLLKRLSMSLKQATIHDIDHVSSAHVPTSAASFSVLPPWLQSIGTLINTFLPIFTEVFHALWNSQTTPTAAAFFAKGAELYPADKAA